jgi:HSP20 family protein
MRSLDFEISLDDRILTVQGTRSDQADRVAFHQMEIHYGDFNSVVELPGPVDVDDVEAKYENGFLQIVLPKTAPHDVSVED